MAELNLGKISGTQTFPVEVNTSTAPEGARIGDLILNSGAAAVTIGGVSIPVGGLAKITVLSPFTCVAKGNVRGATGDKGAKGDPGLTGIISASINEKGELILTTP